MGIFTKLFGDDRANSEFNNILNKCQKNLRIGIITHLHKIYTSDIGSEEAMFLAVALLNVVVVENPRNADGQRYVDNNLQLIMKEAMKISQYQQIGKALSYLYAVSTIQLAFLSGNLYSERAAQLGQRAAELSIYIPNTYDICGSDDMNQCVITIANYSEEFVNRAVADSEFGA